MTTNKSLTELLNFTEFQRSGSFLTQEKNLIKEAFLEALNSARANHGIFSIYQHQRIHQLGINSGSAQHEIMQYFQEEAQSYQTTGLLPNWDSVEFFLERMAFKYKGCVESLLIKKGIILGYDQLETEGVSNEKKDGYGIDGIKRRRGRPPKNRAIGEALLRSGSEPVQRTRSKRKKLSSGLGTETKRGRDELYETSGSSRVHGRRAKSKSPSRDVSTDSDRGADLWSGSGQAKTDSHSGREIGKQRVVLEVV